MGHLDENNVKKLIKIIERMKIKIRMTMRICEAYLEGKQIRQLSYKPVTRASKPLEFIHNDLYGPIDLTSYSETNYYILFTDNFIIITHIYPLKKKSSADVLESFREYKLKVENKQES